MVEGADNWLHIGLDTSTSTQVNRALCDERSHATLTLAIGKQSWCSATKQKHKTALDIIVFLKNVLECDP